LTSPRFFIVCCLGSDRDVAEATHAGCKLTRLLSIPAGRPVKDSLWDTTAESLNLFFEDSLAKTGSALQIVDAIRAVIVTGNVNVRRTFIEGFPPFFVTDAT
jgi:hypothetical protein